MTCSITTSLLGCIVTILLYARYISILNIDVTKKIIIFAFFILIGCIPLFVSYGMESVLGKFFVFYKYGLYFIYIGAVILLSLTIFRDIIWAFAYKIDTLMGYEHFASPLSKVWSLKLNLVNIVITVIITAISLYSGIKTPDLKFTEIVSEKIKNEQSIAILSDLHIHREISGKKIKEIVKKTNEQYPDIILLAGDIIDDDTNKISEITEILKDLKAKKGIFFVTGNHEFYISYKQTVDELNRLGFTFLENSGKNISNDLYIAGIPDLFSSLKHGIKIDIKNAFKESSPSQYLVLASHTPANFKQNNNFDLELSGHTHGGQIFPFHIFAKLYNKYLAGLYNMENNAKIYVSRGAGQWGPQMRFLSPSEISIIKLKPKN